jgi:hypothetical protein
MRELRWGLMSLAFQRRWTVALEAPLALAIVRVLQRLRCLGGRTAWSRIAALVAGSTCGGRPLRSLSSSPARPSRRNLFSHFDTTTRSTMRREATSCWERPRLRNNTMLALVTMRCGLERRPITVLRCLIWSVSRVSGQTGRAMRQEYTDRSFCVAIYETLH